MSKSTKSKTKQKERKKERKKAISGKTLEYPATPGCLPLRATQPSFYTVKQKAGGRGPANRVASYQMPG